jgi:hypothetical protein
VEAEFTRLWARLERAVEELGGMVPASQLRALLIIDDSGVLGSRSRAASRALAQIDPTEHRLNAHRRA